MSSSLAHALFALNQAERHHVKVKLGSTQVKTTNRSLVDGKGGSKKVFGLPDGRAVAIPNLDTIDFKSPEDAEVMASAWARVIIEEKEISERVRNAGLEAQHIEIQDLNVGRHSMPVMVMPRFSALENRGMQVRDVKNQASSAGHSMVFGTPQNLEDPNRLKFVMQGLMDDAVTLLVHGFDFGGDSCNIVIKDTANTPTHDRTQRGLFDEREQKIRFFFFDFSSKHRPRGDERLSLLDKHGNPSRIKIRQYAEYYVTRAYEALMSAIREEELDHILALKKSFSSQHSYSTIFNVWPILDKNFKLIKKGLVEDVTSRVMMGMRPDTVPVQDSSAGQERFSRGHRPGATSPDALKSGRRTDIGRL